MEAWRSSLRVAWPGPRGRALAAGGVGEDGRSQAESALLLLRNVLGVGMAVAVVAGCDALLYYCRRQREAGCMFSIRARDGKRDREEMQATL